MAAFELEVDGAEGWVLIRTDLAGRKLVKDLRNQMPGQHRGTAQLLAGLARDVIARDVAAGAPPLLGMWARIDDPKAAAPAAVARLHMMPVEKDATVQSYAADLLLGSALREPFELTAVETASGEAHHLSAVLDLGADHVGSRLHRTDMIFWLRPADEEAMVLSVQTTDLARAATLGPELRRLAAGVRWGR